MYKQKLIEEVTTATEIDSLHVTAIVNYLEDLGIIDEEFLKEVYSDES